MALANDDDVIKTFPSDRCRFEAWAATGRSADMNLDEAKAERNSERAIRWLMALIRGAAAGDRLDRLLKRYNECRAKALGDQRSRNGTEPTILTPDALAALRRSRKLTDLVTEQVCEILLVWRKTRMSARTFSKLRRVFRVDRRRRTRNRSVPSRAAGSILELRVFAPEKSVSGWNQRRDI
jgi:hypothetical protein